MGMKEFLAQRKLREEQKQAGLPLTPLTPPQPQAQPVKKLEEKKQPHPQPPKPKQPKKGKQPQKAPAEKPAVIVYACGHKAGVKHLEGMKCPFCVKEQRCDKIRKRAIQRNENKDPTRSQRLPNGSNFNLTYDGEGVNWIGTLTIPVEGELTPLTFKGDLSAVIKLVIALDAKYRESLFGPLVTREQVPEIPEAEGGPVVGVALVETVEVTPAIQENKE